MFPIPHAAGSAARLPRLAFGAAFAAALILLSPGARAEDPAPDNPLQDGATWEALRPDILGETPLAEGAPVFTVEAPYRAADAATVPIRIEQNPSDPLLLNRVRVVIDENPSPIAAEIDFGPDMHPLAFETRVRVNQYSNVRVLAETERGTYMAGRFVKASGGCSAPATKDPEAALAGMGETRLRIFGEAPAQSGQMREAQIMIRHPNYSGLQRDQLTHLFISAHFIHQLEVWQGDTLLFRVDGGISISENPVFRFSYRDNGAPEFHVIARDTEGNSFDTRLPKTPPA